MANIDTFLAQVFSIQDSKVVEKVWWLVLPANSQTCFGYSLVFLVGGLYPSSSKTLNIMLGRKEICTGSCDRLKKNAKWDLNLLVFICQIVFSPPLFGYFCNDHSCASYDMVLCVHNMDIRKRFAIFLNSVQYGHCMQGMFLINFTYIRIFFTMPGIRICCFCESNFGFVSNE